MSMQAFCDQGQERTRSNLQSQPKPQLTPKPQRTTNAAEAATMRRNNTPAMQPKPQLGWARTGKDDITQPKPLSPPGSGRTSLFRPRIRQRCSRSRRLFPSLQSQCNVRRTRCNGVIQTHQESLYLLRQTRDATILSQVPAAARHIATVHGLGKDVDICGRIHMGRNKEIQKNCGRIHMGKNKEIQKNVPHNIPTFLLSSLSNLLNILNTPIIHTNNVRITHHHHQ